FGRRGRPTRCPRHPRPGNLCRKMEPASLDLRQRWRAFSRRLGLTTFWQWWAGELVPLIPHRLRNAVARMRMRPILAFEADTAVLFVPEIANSHLAYKEAAR